LRIADGALRVKLDRGVGDVVAEDGVVGRHVPLRTRPRRIASFLARERGVAPSFDEHVAPGSVGGAQRWRGDASELLIFPPPSKSLFAVFQAGSWPPWSESRWLPAKKHVFRLASTLRI
jgi:hypothetical protein